MMKQVKSIIFRMYFLFYEFLEHNNKSFELYGSILVKIRFETVSSHLMFFFKNVQNLIIYFRITIGASLKTA